MGQGGLGKTVLVRAVCDDQAVRGAFPDGMLWATIGQKPEPSRIQRDWIHHLGGDVAAASSLDSGKVELQRLLQDRAMLLVLDDGWNAADAPAFQVGGAACTVLLTTRDATQAVGAALVPLALMQRDESRTLLTKVSGGTLADVALADIIADRLGYLPLALKIVGAQLALGRRWLDIEAALKKGKLQFLTHGQSSVLAAINASVAHLTPDHQERYRELVIFPQDEPLVEAAVARLWARTAKLEDWESRFLLTDLCALLLVQADNTLHDLQYDYLRAVVPEAEQERLHSALADSYGDPTAWASLPDDDELYGWRWLAAHLAHAGRTDDLRVLLTNGSYLQHKIVRSGTAALLTDFELLPYDDVLKQIAGAVRLGAHILDREPRELPNQLIGRLGSLDALHTMSIDEQLCFRLRSYTLTPPGGALLRTFAGHTSSVTSCAFSPDGRFALSASDDQTMRLWDVQTGKGVATWVAGAPLNCCAFHPDGQQVMAGDRLRNVHFLRLENL